MFVEVKTRSSSLFGGAVGAVGTRKRDTMVRTAAAYLSRNRLWERPCRFDIVAIERVDGPPYWRIRHVVDAFRPNLGRRF